ncbi:solute carrier family 23 protein [Nesterenkonia sp. DZ6]|uniref:solute carrier family 23 protein n=1 Tax=Nesterenkonia sp. DZ6 TaxID=2901229 RepID=UPI001F4CFB9E|nr:solute carrier family 23 protein [Nesterenkonia sp. DZ6]MCH8559079.1 hypothetical protein [Nesterenkonia sp. DZ6]
MSETIKSAGSAPEEDGPQDPATSPHWKAGPFEVRLPFVHYRIEWPDYTQGLFMCAVDLAAIPLMVNLLGMPFEVALAVVLINGLLYLTHHMLGDPVVPGWITPAIPLVMAYCETFPEGEERIHALISFQILLGLFSILLGVTGLARRVVTAIPAAIKAGVLMGAGIAAVQRIFGDGGEFHDFPVTITIAVGLAFFIMYSRGFASWRGRNRFAMQVGKLGVLPCILVAVVVAPLAGEAEWSEVEWGIIQPDFMTLWREYTVFGLGLPPLSMFLLAIPTVLATYIVVFGDSLQADAVLKEANKARPDERVEYNPDRAHIIFGTRNTLMGVIGPDVAMAGPVWSAMLVVISERYKDGKKAMKSLYGGVGSFRWGTNTGLLLLPIVTLVEPILGVAMALTLLIQAFVSVRIGIMQARSQRDLGIAGVTAGALALMGAGWGLAVGILLCAVIYGRQFFVGEDDGTFAKKD